MLALEQRFAEMTSDEARAPRHKYFAHSAASRQETYFGITSRSTSAMSRGNISSHSAATASQEKRSRALAIRTSRDSGKYSKPDTTRSTKAYWYSAESQSPWMKE